jgi:hypothetical protein
VGEQVPTRLCIQNHSITINHRTYLNSKPNVSEFETEALTRVRPRMPGRRKAPPRSPKQNGPKPIERPRGRGTCVVGERAEGRRVEGMGRGGRGREVGMEVLCVCVCVCVCASGPHSTPGLHPASPHPRPHHIQLPLLDREALHRVAAVDCHPLYARVLGLEPERVKPERAECLCSDGHGRVRVLF